MTYKQPTILLWLFYFLTLYTPHVFSYITAGSRTSYHTASKAPLAQQESEASHQCKTKYTTETLQLQPYSKQSNNDDWFSLQGDKKYQYIDSFVYKNKEYTSLKLSILSKMHARTNPYGVSHSPLVIIGSQCQQLCWFNESNKSNDYLIYSFFLPREMADSQLTGTLIQEKRKKSRLKKSKKKSKNSVNEIRLTGFSDKDNERFFLDITLNPQELFSQLRHEKKEKILSPLSILKTNPWLEQFQISLLAPITADDEKKSITIKFQPKAEFPSIPEHFKFTLFKEGAITVIPQQGMTLSIPCNQSEEHHLVTVRVTNKSSATLLGAFFQSLTELWSRNDLSSFSWPLWEKTCAQTACNDVLALGASMVLTPIGLSSITPIVPIIISKVSDRLYRSSDTASENSSNESNIQEAIKKLRHEDKLPVLFLDYEVSHQSRSTTLTVVSKQNLKVEETPSLLPILQVQCKNSVSQTMELLLSDSHSLTDLLESSTLRQLCSRDEQLQSRASALQINDPETWLKNTLENLSSKEPKMMTSSELVGYMLNHIHKDDDCRKAIALLSGYTAYSPTSQEVSWLLRTHNIPLEHCIVVLEPVLSSNKKSQPKPASGSFTRSAAPLTQTAMLVGTALYGFLPNAWSMPTSSSGLTPTAQPLFYEDYISTALNTSAPLANICSKHVASSKGIQIPQTIQTPTFCKTFDIDSHPKARESISTFFNIEDVRTYGCKPLGDANKTPTNRYGLRVIKEGDASVDDCLTNYAKDKCVSLQGQPGASQPTGSHSDRSFRDCQLCESSTNTTLSCDYRPPTTVAQTTVSPTTVPQTTVPQTTVPQTTVPQTTVPETTGTEVTVPTFTTTMTTGAAAATGWTAWQIAGAALGAGILVSYPVNYIVGARGWNLVASPFTLGPNIYHKCCGIQGQYQISQTSEEACSQSPIYKHPNQ